MIQVWEINELGFFVDKSYFTEIGNVQIGITLITKPLSLDFSCIKPKFDFQIDNWIEGATQEEIDAWNKENNVPQVPSQNVILSEKVTALEEKVATLESTVNSLVAASPQ